ncbi:MAG: cytochrome C554 [Candidatus Aminicenantes bacterium]|nr:MAG: cytochrome C554 [Candidatus Aminicenantes bacterium]
MKSIKAVSVGLVVMFSVILLNSQEFTYVGAQKCKTCHRSEKRGKQYTLWENSRHAKSFEVLFSDSALEEAKKEKLEKPPSESPECLKCHGPLYEKAPDIKAEGVTCEICHGPGSGYKKISIMKNKDEAIKNGLTVYNSTKDIKTKCITCHQSDTFDFDSSWEKIKHSIPKIK